MDSDRQIWRFIFLALILVAIAGPWTFDQINVPAQYPCSPPFIRLEGDFCGTPMRGITLIFWMTLEVVHRAGAFLTGEAAMAELTSAILPVSLFLLPFLPVITTPLLLLKGDSRPWHIFQAGVLLLVSLLGLWRMTLPGAGLHPVLWGVWLYFTLVFLMLVFELLSLRKAKPVQGYHLVW